MTGGRGEARGLRGVKVWGGESSAKGVEGWRGGVD